MPYTYQLDIDASSPKVIQVGQEGDISTATFGDGNPGFNLSGQGSAGALVSTKASFAACRDSLDTNALNSSFSTRVGRTVCVESSANQGPHLAAIKVLAWSNESFEMDIDVLVWADRP
jgi:hypothetical protein